MLKPIVYYKWKENKEESLQGGISMKKNLMVMEHANDGYELMSKGPSVSVMRTYWKGSPWKAFRYCLLSK